MKDEQLAGEIRSFHKRATTLLVLIFIMLFGFLSGIAFGIYEIYKLYNSHKKDIAAIERKIDLITHPLKTIEKPVKDAGKVIKNIL